MTNPSIARIAINNTLTFFLSNHIIKDPSASSPSTRSYGVYTNRALSDEFCYLTMSISSLDMHIFTGAVMSSKKGPKYDRKKKFASQLMVSSYKAIFSTSSSYDAAVTEISSLL